jgi:hypothetical protein
MCSIAHGTIGHVGQTLSMDARPIDRDRVPYTLPPEVREGDIVVTRVARHYALGRVNADRSTQTPIETQNLRAYALSSACVLAGAEHHVFLYDIAGPAGTGVRVDCTKSLTPKG